MPNRIVVWMLGCCAAGLLPSVPASGLTAREVLVVGSALSEESAELARFYARRRGIEAGRVVLLRVPAAMDISRADYNSRIRDVLRKEMADRKLTDQVRCICLVWGVPVRIVGTRESPEEQTLAAVQAAGQRLQSRLAVDCQLLGAVGKEFPPPRTDGLAPLGALFASPMPAPPTPLPRADQLRTDVHRLLGVRQVEAEKLADPAQRRIALRQLQALHLDLGGLQGLIDHIRDARAVDAPPLADLQKRLDTANRRLAELRSAKAGGETIGQFLEQLEQTSGVLTALSYADTLAGQLRKIAPLVNSDAAVDSELACLLWDDYPLRGPAANPLNWRRRDKPSPRTILTARIDGPTSADAMRIVKASLAVEAEGLTGTFYIDAGGPDRVGPVARAQYDARLVGLARLLARHSSVKIVLDEKPAVFAPDSCPHAALYVGWYSLQKYVPAFMWKPGAVGWHIASWEAMHLRDPASQEWCGKMIQNGVAATLGAVAEPLLNQFPNPEEFFPLLLTGRYTVAECYWRTLPSASWQITLIADPLYSPFSANPQIKPADLPPGLAP